MSQSLEESAELMRPQPVASGPCLALSRFPNPQGPGGTSNSYWEIWGEQGWNSGSRTDELSLGMRENQGPCRGEGLLRHSGFSSRPGLFD